MVVLHAFLALVSGFATMAVLVVLITALLQKLTPGWVGESGKSGRGQVHRLTNPGYVFVNLGYSFLAAAAGGYVTAWIAAEESADPRSGSGHHRIASRGAQRPAATRTTARLVLLSAGCVTPLGVLAGGLVRLRVLGML